MNKKKLKFFFINKSQGRDLRQTLFFPKLIQLREGCFFNIKQLQSLHSTGLVSKRIFVTKRETFFEKKSSSRLSSKLTRVFWNDSFYKTFSTKRFVKKNFNSKPRVQSSLKGSQVTSLFCFLPNYLILSVKEIKSELNHYTFAANQKQSYTLSFLSSQIRPLIRILTTRIKHDEDTFGFILSSSINNPSSFSRKITRILYKGTLNLNNYEFNKYSPITVILLALFSTMLNLCEQDKSFTTDSAFEKTLDKVFEQLDQKGRGQRWVIRVDLTQSLISFPSKKLWTILEDKFFKNIEGQKNCTPFWHLCKMLMKAGWIHTVPISKAYPIFNHGYATFISKSQQNLKLPFWQPIGQQISNHILKPIDNWGASQSIRWNCKKRKSQDSKYTRILHLISTLRRKKWDSLPAPKEKERHNYGEYIGYTIDDLRCELWKTPSVVKDDKNFKRVLYVRHGAEILLTVGAPLDIAKQIKAEFKEQLNQIGLENFSITLQPLHKPFVFSGWEITSLQKSFLSFTTKKLKQQTQYNFNSFRRVTPRLRFRAPLSQIYRWFGNVGFFRWGINPRNRWSWRPTCQKLFVKKSHNAILSHFNSITKVIENYYILADNAFRVRVLLQRLHHSAALTLALKYKTSREQVIERFGPFLKDPKTGNSLRKIQIYKRQRSLSFDKISNSSLFPLSFYAFSKPKKKFPLFMFSRYYKKILLLSPESRMT